MERPTLMSDLDPGGRKAGGREMGLQQIEILLGQDAHAHPLDGRIALLEHEAVVARLLETAQP